MAILKLKHGSSLEYFDNGIQNENAILFLHGTPGDGTAWAKWFSEISECRAISTSRPGYGNSDRIKGRTVASDLDTQREILDYFGIKKFVVIGWSGGGPHSLNMTRDLRCAAAFTLAGVGEWGKSDLNFLDGMGPENHDEFGEALKGEVAISKWMDTNAPAMQSVSGEDLISALGGLIGDADKRALTKEIAEEMAATFRSALKKGFTGWIDDDLAFVQPFGFELEKITKPVIIWQGNDDFMVPQSHSEWLHKHIPGSKLNFVPGHGHISIGESFRSEIIKAALEYLR